MAVYPRFEEDHTAGETPWPVVYHLFPAQHAQLKISEIFLVADF